MDPATIAFLGSLLAALGAAGAIALARRVPAVMTWFKRYFAGLHLLVIGQQGAGKTSFYNYLRFDCLTDEYPTHSTHRVSKALSFDSDKGGELQLQIKEAFDIPGELEPHVQAELARKRTPEALLVFVSATEEGAILWLDRLVHHLAIALATDAGFAKKLRCLTLIVNKTDSIAPEEAKRLVTEVHRIIENRLHGVLGSRSRLVDVLPCTLVRTAGGERAANAIILAVISSVRNNRGLVPR